MVVMEFGTGKAAHIGKKGGGDPEENMYGDFAVGNGTGEPWPKQEESPTSKATTGSAWLSKTSVLAKYLARQYRRTHIPVVKPPKAERNFR